MKRWQDQQKNVPEGHFNLVEALRQGQLQLYKEHQEHEKERVNIVRGGSSGAVYEGRIYGECQRKAHLRYKGISTPLDEHIELMTRQGEQNEDIFIKELEAAGYCVSTQDRLGLDITLPNGERFIGSPDIALVKKDGEPIVALENKNISSVSTAKAVHYDLEPRDAHLIQSATYSYRLGELFGKPHIPYQLVYSSRSIWHMFGASKKVKESVEKAQYDTGWNFGKLMSIQPFHRIYYLDWRDDVLHFWTEGMALWQPTAITKEGIDTYADVVSKKIEESGQLGPRPSGETSYGVKSYSPCNYCSFKEVCDQFEDADYQMWIDHAKKLADEKHKEREQLT